MEPSTTKSAVINAAGNTVSGVLGMIGQRKREKRAMANQQQLMQDQKRNQMELNKQGHDLQLQMWKDTNYPAQIEMLKEAGLNPSLMYNNAGGSATTAGNQAGGSAAGGNAPAPQQMPMTMANMTESLMAAAQIGLLKSQAKNLDADTEKKKGVDTVEAQTRIESLTQGIENQKAVEALTRAQKELTDIDILIKDATTQNVIHEIIAKSEKAIQEAQIASFQKDVDEATIENKIEIIKQNAIGAALMNTLNRLGIDKIKAETANISEQTRLLGAKIYDTYRQIDLAKYANETDRMNAETNALRQAVEEYLGEGNLTMREWEFTARSLEGVIGKFKPRKTITTKDTWGEKGTSTSTTTTTTK